MSVAKSTTPAKKFQPNKTAKWILVAYFRSGQSSNTAKCGMQCEVKFPAIFKSSRAAETVARWREPIWPFQRRSGRAGEKWPQCALNATKTELSERADEKTENSKSLGRPRRDCEPLRPRSALLQRSSRAPQHEISPLQSFAKRIKEGRSCDGRKFWASVDSLLSYVCCVKPRSIESGAPITARISNRSF